MMRLVVSLTVAVLLSTTVVRAQYEFGNKKFEKLYYQFEDYYANYDYENIIDKKDEMLGYVEPLQDTLTAAMYSFIAESYYIGLGDRQAALEFYQKEFDTREKTGNATDFGMKNLLYQIAAIWDEIGQYDESDSIYISLLESSLKTYGPKSPEYLETALAFGVHYKNISQYDKAIELYSKNLKRLKKSNELYPTFLSELGANYFIKGAYQESERALNSSLESYEDQGRYVSTEYVGTLINYANLHKGMGKYPEALDLFSEGNSILDRLTGDHEEFYATLYNNIAVVNMGMGNTDLARKYYERTLELEEQLYTSEDPTYAITLSNLADTYMDFYQFGKSEELYQQALEIFSKSYGEKNYYYANTLTQLAYLYRISLRFDEALEYQQKSVDIYEEIFGDDQIDYAWVTSNLGDLYANIGRKQEADKIYQKAMAIRAKRLGRNHPLYAESTNKMAILKWAREEHDQAEDYYKRTFENYFGQIEAFFPTLSEEEKAKFYKTKLKPAFEQFNSFAFEGSRESKHLNGLMYDYRLATKGLIMYATSKVRQAIFDSGDSTLINKYNTWIEYKEQLSKLYSTLELEPEERNYLIDSITTLANDEEKELSIASKAFAKTFTSEKITWKDVQSKLKPNEAAVEIIRFRNFLPDSAGFYNGEIYYAALIVREDTKDYPDLVLLRSGNDLEKKFIAYYRNAIKFSIDDQYSYHFFWRPIANRLKGINKVYFSPDGVFNQLNINTLKNPESGDYLIDEMSIQVMNNTKDLITYADNTSSYPGEKIACLIGYPNYDKGLYASSQKKTSTADASDASQEVRGMSRGARGSSNSNSGPITGGISSGLRGNLQRYIDSNSLLALLPGTKKEVELIEEIYNGNNSRPITYLEDRAIETNVKNVKNPHTLHIATHGFFLEDGQPVDIGSTDDYVQNPLLRSGLIFAGANSFLSSGNFLGGEDDGQDGILTAFEAMNMNLDDTELVVMSACETGLGEVTNGEGVYGLQRSFQIAGAKTIIMSIWTVDDDATQQLMTNFYSEWLKTGDKLSAFIAAQQKLREKYNQPYYWGAFVMVGQ